MKSQNLILCVLTSAVLGFGCGGASTGAEEPAAPAAAAEDGAGDELSTEADETGTGEDMAMGDEMGAESADGLSATELGPQIGAGKVRFNFKPAGRAKKIYLAGNFKGWDSSGSAFLLSDDDGDGIYSITIDLDPGVYQYKFVIDGQWTKDPNSPGSNPDGFGGQNGKFEVK